MRLSFISMLLIAAFAAAEPTRRDIKGTELLVQAELDELQAPHGEVAYHPSASLAQVLPNYLFVRAHFPDAMSAELPKPLQVSNIFAVDSDGIAKLLATPEDVLELFKSSGKPAKSPDDVKKAVEAALALESAKYPGQPFGKPQNVQVKPNGMGGFTGSGSCEPTTSPTGAPSGTGPISVTCNFGGTGKPTGITMVNNYRPPVRRKGPIKPADIAADKPVAEKAAGGPVTNINAPTINRFMPGQTVFTTPNKAKKGTAAVVAVDPSGQPHVLPAFGPLFQYVRKQSGKLTTEQQVRDMATTFVTLVTSMFPAYKFDPVQESDVKVKPLDGGGFELMATVYVTGDKSKWFYTHWFIGPKGNMNRWGFYPKGLSE